MWFVISVKKNRMFNINDGAYVDLNLISVDTESPSAIDFVCIYVIPV